MAKTTYLLLADLLLYLHFLVVGFLLAGFVVIWLGHWRGWRFVHSFYFRIAHLGVLGVVTLQAIVGQICPLTTWEDELRLRAGEDARYPGSFIAYWVQRVLYYDVDLRWLAALYAVFFAAVLATCWRVRIQPPTWWRRSNSK